MASPVALISDIHGNTPALKAVLADIEASGCTRLVVIGDIVNGVDPVGSVALLMAHGQALCLSGNAEWYLLTPDLDAFPVQRFPYIAEVIALVRWWRSRLAPAQLRWLEQLPQLIRDHGSCYTHDTPLDRLSPERRAAPDLDPRYHELHFHSKGLAPGTPAEVFEENAAWMEENGVHDLFCGHTHEPFVRQLGSRRICNTGSVGMPLDGDPRASWVLCEPRSGQRPSLNIRRVAYDVDATWRLVDQAAAVGYPRFEQPDRLRAYKQGLASGTHWRVHLSRQG
jgi:predicted phosphodiesterase